MMSDLGDDYRAWREHKRQRRREKGQPCPGCVIVQPRRDPTIMMPGQKCRVCGVVRRADGTFHGGPLP
jgi:hypothetical protein